MTFIVIKKDNSSIAETKASILLVLYINIHNTLQSHIALSNLSRSRTCPTSQTTNSRFQKQIISPHPTKKNNQPTHHKIQLSLVHKSPIPPIRRPAQQLIAAARGADAAPPARTFFGAAAPGQLAASVDWSPGDLAPYQMR